MSHEDLEELRRAIELKLKLGKLDSLLLFVPTLLGLVFSLIQYSTGMIRQMTDALALVPVLLLGIGVPVYIGYYRGGIKLDSITERARGWVYLVLGIYLYLFSSIRGIFEKYLPSSYGLAGLTLTFLTTFPTAYIASGVGCGVVSVAGRNPSKEEIRTFRVTGLAATMLMLSSKWMIEYLVTFAEGEVVSLIAVGRFAALAMIFHFALVFELSARETIWEGLRSPMMAVKSTLTVLGSVSLLLGVASFDTLSKSFSDSSKVLLGVALVLLGVYLALTVILVRKEIRRSSIAKRSEEERKKRGGFRSAL